MTVKLLQLFLNMKIKLEAFYDQKKNMAAANILFLKPGGVTSKDGKSLKDSFVLRNKIQCFKSRLQK